MVLHALLKLRSQLIFGNRWWISQCTKCFRKISIARIELVGGVQTPVITETITPISHINSMVL